MHPRTLIVLAGLAIVVTATLARFAEISIHRQLEREVAGDRREVARGLARTVDAPPHRIGTLSPYRVATTYPVVETGGPEQATIRFVDDVTGLTVEVDIHTCRPRHLGAGERSGELNLVDGTPLDRCTSGGTIRIIPAGEREPFELMFKLLGAPNGSINWNAEQLISDCDGERTWLEALDMLRVSTGSAGLPVPAVPYRQSEQHIATVDARDSSRTLMHGPREDMLRLLTFRELFGALYATESVEAARGVVSLTLETLLKSPVQQDLSEQWRQSRHGVSGQGT